MKAKQKIKLTVVLLIMGISSFIISCNDDEKPKTVPAIVTIEVREITTTSATGGGEISDDGNVEIISSGVVYSNLVSEPTIEDNRTIDTPTDGVFVSKLENLISNTTYYLRAYATNSVGTGYGEVLEFTTGNESPTISDILITGTAEVNMRVEASYTYSDSENDEENGSIFQWYIANDGIGSGETPIHGATGLSYTIVESDKGKYLRFGVVPKAATGTASGVEVKSTFIGAVGDATTVTFTYNGKSVTYGILTSTVTGRKWLDRNLGATNKPSSVTDFANYGDLFQWGRRADGHQLMARNGPTSAETIPINSTTATLSTADETGHSLFITPSAAPADWRTPQNNNLWQGASGTNNPCPSGWRLPTSNEWSDETLGNLDASFAQLKLTHTGIRSQTNGNPLQVDISGQYWTSTVGTTIITRAKRISITASGSTLSEDTRAFARACRCIKN